MKLTWQKENRRQVTRSHKLYSLLSPPHKFRFHIFSKRITLCATHYPIHVYILSPVFVRWTYLLSVNIVYLIQCFYAITCFQCILLILYLCAQIQIKQHAQNGCHSICMCMYTVYHFIFKKPLIIFGVHTHTCIHLE